jgi:hypothetical protein
VEEIRRAWAADLHKEASWVGQEQAHCSMAVEAQNSLEHTKARRAVDAAVEGRAPDAGRVRVGDPCFPAPASKDASDSRVI